MVDATSSDDTASSIGAVYWGLNQPNGFGSRAKSRCMETKRRNQYHGQDDLDCRSEQRRVHQLAFLKGSLLLSPGVPTIPAVTTRL